jgi:hypothetical protein
MIHTLIAAVVVLLVFIIVTSLSMLRQPGQISFRQVQRSIRREAKWATRRLRKWERQARRFNSIGSAREEATRR